MNLLEIERDSSIYEKFLKRITINEKGCWEVSGPKNGAGYTCVYIPTLQNASKTEFSHRYTYELFNGKIPKGLHIDHLCRNKCCANPDHLEAVTGRENIRRGESLKALKERRLRMSSEERSAEAKHASSFNVKRNLIRTHCKNGHEVKPETTRIERNGSRRCRICLGISNARFYSKNKKDI